MRRNTGASDRGRELLTDTRQRRRFSQPLAPTRCRYWKGADAAPFCLSDRQKETKCKRTVRGQHLLEDFAKFKA